MTTRPTVWLASNPSSCSSSERGTRRRASCSMPPPPPGRRDLSPSRRHPARPRAGRRACRPPLGRTALRPLGRRARPPLAPRRGHPDRQQTLAATLDWSHDLLLDDERVAFRRLAVFAGGFDLDAAATVAAIGDVIDVLSRLVDKSLVTAETTGEAARFRMLEVVRQYAEAQLRDAGELRHASSAIEPGTRRRRRVTTPTAVCPSCSNLHRGSTPRWTTCAPRSPRVRRATVPGPAARRQHVASPAVAGAARRSPGLADGCPRTLPGSVGIADARPVRQGVLHLRRADIEPVAGVADDHRASRGLGEEAVTIAGDQAAILTLMAHDWATPRDASTAALARGEIVPVDRRPAPVTSRPCWRWRSVRWTRLEALLPTPRLALDRVPGAPSPRSSPR